MLFECVLCKLSPDDEKTPAVAILTGMSLCERDLKRVAEVLIDGFYTSTDIIKDAVTGNW